MIKYLVRYRNADDPATCEPHVASLPDERAVNDKVTRLNREGASILGITRVTEEILSSGSFGAPVVSVVIWEGRHGTSVSVHLTEQGAIDRIVEKMKEYWPSEVVMPDDIAAMHEIWNEAGDGDFTVETHELNP